MAWILDYKREEDGTFTVSVQTELGVQHRLRGMTPVLHNRDMGDGKPGIALMRSCSGRVLPVHPAAKPYLSYN